MCFAVTPVDMASSKWRDRDAPGVDSIGEIVEAPILERSHGPQPL